MTAEPLERYLRVQRASDRAMYKLLNAAARETAQAIAALELKDGIGAAVRREQLRLVMVEIRREQARLWDGVSSVVQEHRLRSAIAAADAETAMERVLMEAVDDPRAVRILRDANRATARAGLESLASRASGESARPLSQLVYRNRELATGRISSLVNNSLAMGRNAREIAREVRRCIKPGTPGGASYAALRLGRTEINNAFHSTQIRMSADKPWTQGYRWNLSGSHSKPDECNDYAAGDHSGLGRGVFSVRDVPAKPHPQCLCYLTTVVPSRDDFISAYMSGEYDSFMRGIGY